MTAGVIIPSVPAANAVYRRLESASPGHTLEFSRKLKSVLPSKTVYEHERSDSMEIKMLKKNYQMINEKQENQTRTGSIHERMDSYRS